MKLHQREVTMITLLGNFKVDQVLNMVASINKGRAGGRPAGKTLLKTLRPRC